MPEILVFSGPALPLLDMANSMKPDDWNLHIRTSESPEAEIAQAAEIADFILVFGHGVSDDVLRLAKKTKLVQLCSAGFDGINLGLAGELGIPVANNGGANAIPVAEFAITLALSTIRHLIITDADTRAGDWMRPEVDGRDSHELFGATVGIIGAGRIGSTVAGMLRGFETTTLYTDKIRSEKAESFGATRVELDELLKRSDIVTLHTPLDSSTRALISERELSLMKNTAVLINTCRGPVVDEKALYQALKDDEIWGAGLDVFEQEPVDPDNPLLKLDNVVVAPHIAGKSYESYPRRVRFAFENMKHVWDGGRPESIVNPE
ncbi:MAG: 2-hydroxyacid dehydrogenase [Dehalococcoidia bacterium]|jgi:glyoxylate reductase/D-3-phosphoglycerate dehydrogenase|nr:2-hydroxyacid dehydrogenase [Dehalococcoidia bacterium]MDP7261290.1 2-hydroxyacid dehydrogenase [Dehalococcoidia bacterium]